VVITTHNSCGSSFEVSIVSAQFQGKAPLARHRLVNKALGSLMDEKIHPLSIKSLKTPEHAAA
jgi:stress-induced morphogen